MRSACPSHLGILDQPTRPKQATKKTKREKHGEEQEEETGGKQKEEGGEPKAASKPERDRR